MAIRNDKDPRDARLTARVYSSDKEHAIQRAFESGDNLSHLVACFVAGYGAGYALPEWFDKVDLKADPETRSQLAFELPETNG